VKGSIRINERLLKKFEENTQGYLGGNKRKRRKILD